MHSAFIVQLILSHIYAFLCLYFDSVSILYNIFVELQHFILFSFFLISTTASFITG